MRKLLTVCAALVVVLGVVSGNLWRELRSARLQIGDLENQLAHAQGTVAWAPRDQTPLTTTEAPPATAVAPQIPLPPLFRPAAPRAPDVPAPVVSASVSQPLIGNNDQERRADALMQSDRTATARVSAWSTVLNLKPEQLEALNAVTKAELQRETEDSLQIDSRNRGGPMDAQTAARLKVETVTRQHETLVRIHEKMAPQLTPEQGNRMRTMFDAWLATNMARARMEQERAAISGY